MKCLDLALIDSDEGLKQLKEEIYIMCQLVSKKYNTPYDSGRGEEGCWRGLLAFFLAWKMLETNTHVFLTFLL